MWDELSDVVVSLLPQLVQCLEREELRVLALSVLDVIFRHMSDPSPLAAYFHTNSVFAKLMELLSSSFVLSSAQTPEEAGKKSGLAASLRRKKKQRDKEKKTPGVAIGRGDSEDPMVVDSMTEWLAGFEEPPSLGGELNAKTGLLGGPSHQGRTANGSSGKLAHASKTADGRRKREEEAESESRNKLKTAEMLCHLFLQMSRHTLFAEALAVTGLMNFLSNDSLPAFREMQNPYTPKVPSHSFPFLLYPAAHLFF